MITAWVLWGASAHAADVQRWAVVIGANQGGPGDEQLLYAEHDAERVATVLTDLGEVPSENLVLLRSEPAERVAEVLDGLARRIAVADDADGSVLVVYYSGHGDADALHLGDTTMPLTDLTDALDAIPVDVRLLVVDACQSGELTRLKGAVQAEPFTIHSDDRLQSEGLAIITASSPGEDAQESDRLQGGVFTHHLVTGLRGAADASGDGRVTLGEAYHYGKHQTIASTSRARFVQHPTYRYEMRGQDELVLTRLDASDRTGQLALAQGGSYLVFDARREGDLRAEVALDEGGALLLPPGEYLVRLREPDAVREATVHVRRGESVLLERDGMNPVPYGQTVRRGLVEDKRSAAAISIGGGVTGASLPGLSPGPLATAGFRVDLEPLSVLTRTRWSPQRSSNDSLTLHQHAVGADLALVRWMDLGPVSPGVGVRTGADLVMQRFETEGVAPARAGAVGRVGPWLGAQVALGQRSAIDLSGGADVQVYRALSDAWTTVAVPHVTLEWVAYVR